MTDIVNFLKNTELINIISGTSAAVSSMSVSEAVAATGSEITQGLASFEVISGGVAAEASVAGDTAAAIAAFKNAGGVFSATGAATAGASSAGNLCVIETFPGASGVTATGGILTMSLPSVFAAVAPILGVAVGVGLYELSPDFWTKVSQKLLPFCWDDTEVIPAIVDENNQVYVSSEVVEAIRELFLEEKIGSTNESEWDISPIPSNFKSFQTMTTYNDYGGTGKYYTVYEFTTGDGKIVSSFDSIGQCLQLLIASRTYNAKVTPRVIGGGSGDPISCPYSHTYRGLTVYFGYSRSVSARPRNWISADNLTLYTDENWANNDNLDKLGKAAWSMIFGEHSVYYPDGLNEFGGQNVVPGKSIGVATGESSNTKPFEKIYLPVGDPTITVNPEIQPNPQAPTLPEALPQFIPNTAPDIQYPQEVPYIEPEPAKRKNPLPNIAEEIQPSVNPSYNPSVKPEYVPESPEALPEAKSDGDSGLPVFPPENFPTIVASGSGLIHVYNLTPAQMIAFGQWLWVTYADATIDKIWSNPMDGIIGAFEIYATPSTSGNDYIRSGFLVSDVQGALVNPRYKRINCGSVVIPEYYGNYLDYSPYSKAHICLPFIGVVELNSDDIVGHAVNVTYTIDMYNGSCIAQITVAKENYECMMYQYSGNCAVDVPIAGGSQAAIKAGMLGAAANGITSVLAGIAAGGAIGGIAGAAVGMGGGVIGAALSNKASVQHSGTFGSSFGAMGPKKPYIIIHRPIERQVANYNREYGFPAHKRVVIGSCSGFLRAFDVHVISPTATDEEKAQIEEMLKSGVFV